MSVVLPFGNSIPPGDPNPDIIERLEELLEDARSGALRGLAYATSRGDGVVGTGWAGSDGSRDPISTAIAILGQRYTRSIIEGDP